MFRYFSLLLSFRCVQSSIVFKAAPSLFNCHIAVVNMFSKVQLHTLYCCQRIGMTATCAQSKSLDSICAAFPPCPAGLRSPTCTRSVVLMTPSHCISCALSLKQHVCPHGQLQPQAGLLLPTLLSSFVCHSLLMAHG